MVPESPSVNRVSSPKEGPASAGPAFALPAPTANPCLPASCSTQLHFGTRRGFCQGRPPDTKRKPAIDKKCAAGSVSRQGTRDGEGQGAKKTPNGKTENAGLCFGLYKSIMNSLLALYRKWRLLKSALTRRQSQFIRRSCGRRNLRYAAMKMEFDAEILWLVPLALALWFMIWVLWNWWQEWHR